MNSTVLKLMLALAVTACGSLETPIGPVGGPGGNPFNDTRESYSSSFGPNTKLTTIKQDVCRRVSGITNADFVTALQFSYIQPDGSTFSGARRGGNGLGICTEWSGDTPPVRLDLDEFIIGITGQEGQYLQDLTYFTNKRVINPAPEGYATGHFFTLMAPPGFQIRQFFGAAGSLIDSIGIYAEPLPALGGGAPQALGLGAVGGWGGNDFNDNPRIDKSIKVKKVIIGESGCINFIQLQYADASGNIVGETDQHGGYGVCPGANIRGPISIQSIPLDDDEFITGLIGSADTVVEQLSIRTNKRLIGPIGGDSGRAFWLPAPDGYQVRALWGRSGTLLDAIGIAFDKR